MSVKKKKNGKIKCKCIEVKHILYLNEIKTNIFTYNVAAFYFQIF